MVSRPTDRLHVALVVPAADRPEGPGAPDAEAVAELLEVFGGRLVNAGARVDVLPLGDLCPDLPGARLIGPAAGPPVGPAVLAAGYRLADQLARSGAEVVVAPAAGGVLWAVAAQRRQGPAAPPAAAAQPGTEAAPVTVKPVEEKKKDDKLHAFNMDKKPWGSVFAWLSERTGKPVIASAAQPTGTFSFTSPPGKRYSIPEVIDIINDGLLGNSATQKFYMINRERNFTVVPADEKVDPALLARSRPSPPPTHSCCRTPSPISAESSGRLTSRSSRPPAPR